MCGLFGFVDLEGAASAMCERGRRALATLAHRGPDQWSDALDENVYMGHRRLSILDLSEAGRQPMTNFGRDLLITVNGEIYNYSELRRELDGFAFQSRSDSEIVLHGYRAWGVDGLLERMDGMYAFCIFDRATRVLTLARDRVGIKPLYYARVGRLFVWASELKAICSFLQGENLTADTTALYDFLTYRYVPSPKTPFIEVRKLAPAHVLTFDATSGRMEVRRYWHLETACTPLSLGEACEELRSRIRESVGSHLASDVPLGSFLSGGIDSTIVTYHARSLVDRMATFSIGFDEKSYDETGFAEIAARAFSTDHHVKRLSRQDSQDLVGWMRSIYDEPFGDYSALPTWHVSQFARQRVTVALSGDGGDELFGGYPWYERIPRITRGRGMFSGLVERMPPLRFTKRPKTLWRRLWNRVALHAGMGIFELYVVAMNGVPHAARRAFRESLGIASDYDDYWYLRENFRPDLPLKRALQYLDFHTYLPDDILTKVDRASMAVSLECRVPLLARSVVDWAFQMPEDVTFHGGELKGMLKHAYRGILPEPIITRGKKGFGIPTARWQVLGDDESFEIGVLRDYLLSASPAVSCALTP